MSLVSAALHPREQSLRDLTDQSLGYRLNKLGRSFGCQLEQGALTFMVGLFWKILLSDLNSFREI